MATEEEGLEEGEAVIVVGMEATGVAREVTVVTEASATGVAGASEEASMVVVMVVSAVEETIMAVVSGIHIS